MKKRVVIVGGGINGLTAANYLRKQNFDVKILEKNDNIGGACVKDSVIINKKPVDYPKGATVLGMMQMFIFEETNLSKFIKTYYPKSPKLVYFKNNLEPTRIYQDVDLLKKELQIKWNEKGDIEGFRNDEAIVIKYLQNIYKKSTIPDISDAENKLGKKITELWIKGSAYDLLNHYFTSEKTKLYMGMTVTESGPASIFQKGTAFTIPLMDSGSIFNGYWGFVKNGIWEISENLGKINESIGVKIDYSVSIKNIDHKSKKIFLDNKELDYDYLLFATDPITPARLLKDDKIIKTVDLHANTSAASIPTALVDAIEDGTIKGNDTLVITAVGAGLTWGGAALRLGNRITPLGETDVDLPPYEGTGIDVIRESINYFVPDKAE